jgi:predicted ATP-grasp superfamily ATP-dependent carboligase
MAVNRPGSPDTRSRQTVLVLDGDERASLAVVRSLVRGGFNVIAASHRGRSYASVSRGAVGVVIDESALLAPRAYALRVAELARQAEAALVIPVTDASLEAVAEWRGELPSACTLPFAPLDVYRRASDKVTVHQLACEFGVGIEDTVVVDDPNAPAPADARLYPGVVKPHRSVVGATLRRKTAVSLVADAVECEAVLRRLPAEAFPVLVQRRIHGPGEGYFVARWKGATLARFAHRRLREKPPSGGVSVYRESIAVDERMQRACDAILDRLQWEGVAMIEGKRDDVDGVWRVIEINGRFWGSLQLAVDAGVDFPTILAEAALGRPFRAPPEPRRGIRLRWEWGDADHLLLRLIRSRQKLNLPAQAPGRIGALFQFLHHRLGVDRLEMFRLRDPWPFLLETARRLGANI